MNVYEVFTRLFGQTLTHFVVLSFCQFKYIFKLGPVCGGIGLYENYKDTKRFVELMSRKL